MNGLEKLIAKYTDRDDVVEAIRIADARAYQLMREFPSGVPSGIMFTANVMGAMKTSQMLAGMLVELAGEIRNWTPEEVQVQEALTIAALNLITSDAMYETLKTMRYEEPKGDTDVEKS